MNSKEIEPLIHKAIASEYESANEKFPPFNSVHEGYAVLLEEVEEAKAEIESIEVYMKTLWSAVKRDYNKSCFASAYDVKCAAIRATQELVQVCAMCDKFCDMEEGNEQFYTDEQLSNAIMESANEPLCGYLDMRQNENRNWHICKHSDIRQNEHGHWAIYLGSKGSDSCDHCFYGRKSKLCDGCAERISANGFYLDNIGTGK